MKKYFTLACALCFFAVNAQNVGINTTSPSATLDVDGNVKIRTVDAAAVATTYDYLVVDPATEEVQKVNGNFASATNTTIAKAKLNDGLSLLNITILGSDFKKIDFNSSTESINLTTNFDLATGQYTVPSTGIYEIYFYFRFGTGVQANLLSNLPSIGILRTVAGNTSTLDEKPFSGVNLLVANVTISASEINSIYELNQGDKISFGFDKGGLLSLSLLGRSRAEFVIKKISN